MFASEETARRPFPDEPSPYLVRALIPVAGKSVVDVPGWAIGIVENVLPYFGHEFLWKAEERTELFGAGACEDRHRAEEAH